MFTESLVMEMRECASIYVTLILFVIFASIVHHVSKEVKLHYVVESTQLFFQIINGISGIFIVV